MNDCKWCFEKKLLSLQKFDALSRSSFQDYKYSERAALPKVILGSANVYDCSYKKHSTLENTRSLQ